MSWVCFCLFFKKEWYLVLGVECEIGICVFDCEIYCFVFVELDECDFGFLMDKFYW